MNDAPVRLLFVPVSGPRGMGEYARSLAIATAAQVRWPHAEIRFALSREAPYAADTPFPTTLLPSSATFHPREVAALIRELRPHIVLFDNAGRTAQLKTARRVGARVVFISSRVVPRRRAFRLRWMQLIDEHWVAYPRFLAGELGWLERAKLAVLGRPLLRFLNPVLPPENTTLACEVLSRLGLTAGGYIVVAPGGAPRHAGREKTLQAIADAASMLGAHGYPTVLVGLDQPVVEPVRLAPRMPLATFIELLRHARLAVVNGGYTMLQALACDRPCVAVPVAGDQAARIDRCVTAGLVVRASEAEESGRVALELLGNTMKLEALHRARANLGLANGMGVVEDALAALLESHALRSTAAPLASGR